MHKDDEYVSITMDEVGMAAKFTVRTRKVKFQSESSSSVASSINKDRMST